MEFITAHWPEIVAFLAAGAALFVSIARTTPNKLDDKIADAVAGFLKDRKDI